VVTGRPANIRVSVCMVVKTSPASTSEMSEPVRLGGRLLCLLLGRLGGRLLVLARLLGRLLGRLEYVGLVMLRRLGGLVTFRGLVGRDRPDGDRI